MANAVTKTILKNGLTVHLKEIHTAPLISHWMWYRVGARNEQTGLTGLSHWVEHMQFKGTPRFPTGLLDKAISRDGGVWNAFTYMDWTAYFETLPADKIKLAFELEAYRMINSLFEPEEVEAERSVIISEREGNENDPLFRLDEVIQKTAIRQHSYRHEIIGEKEDLLRIQRDDLYNHYRAHYVPGNVVFTAAGDFDSQQVLELVEELYGEIPAGQAPEVNPTREDIRQQEERVEVKGPGETTYLRLAYQAPAASDSLLSGPTGLNMFGGGGITNKTSRLYRALVEKELAISVHGGLSATLDPYLYDLTMIVHPQCSPEGLLAALDDEIKRLQDQVVSSDEIARAVKQARAMFAYGSENITNQAFWLGYAEMFANYDWFLTFVSELEKVTPADMLRAAQQYLTSARRVVGTYLPVEGEA
jgi:zinc protease